MNSVYFNIYVKYNINMANDMDKLNQTNLTPDDNNQNSIRDSRITNEDGGRSLVDVLKNPDFKPSDLYHDSSNLSTETGLPKEAGKLIKDVKDTRTVNHIHEERIEHYDYFEDGDSKTFTHNLDRPFIPTPTTDSSGRISYSNLNDFYLGSWYGTKGDNEDPIIFGFDLEIDIISSPLFNEAIEDFITNSAFSSIEEVTARLDILKEFRLQFFKFFNANGSKDSITPSKVHYFKKINGLDRLINRVDSENKKGLFVDYQKEFLTVTLAEDVSMNMGYLISLYNALAWSRVNGKMIIPENLLRFNMKVVVTEIRKYERVMKTGDISFQVLADNLSKHIYTLYECQMFFNNQPHDTDIDLGSKAPFNEVSMRFNYKYFSHKFEKFTWDPEKSENRLKTHINDEYLDPKKYGSLDSNDGRIQNGEFQIDNPKNIYKTIDTFIKNYEDISSSDLAAAVLKGEISVIEAMKQAEKKNTSKINTLFNKTVDELINIGKREMNRRINKRARLFNDSMVKYRQMVPGGMGISEPTNVYSNSTPLENDLKNAVGNFIGNSLKMLLGK